VTAMTKTSKELWFEWREACLVAKTARWFVEHEAHDAANQALKEYLAAVKKEKEQQP